MLIIKYRVRAMKQPAVVNGLNPTRLFKPRGLTIKSRISIYLQQV